MERVMTTWHDGETMDDIINFALNATHFHDHDFEKFLVLFIGAGDGLKDEVQKAIDERRD